VVDRLGDTPEPELREQVARALYNQGGTLALLGRSEEAIEVYDELVDRFGNATELREQVARALYNKGVALGLLGRTEEAIGVFKEVVDRFGDATEPELRRIVTRIQEHQTGRPSRSRRMR
jgi:tetratricopeptide (TPR) repeat protein